MRKGVIAAATLALVACTEGLADPEPDKTPSLTPGPGAGSLAVGGEGPYVVFPDNPNPSGGHGCGVGEDGRVRCWGWNWFGQLGNGTGVDATAPAAVSSGERFASVSAGTMHTCGLTTGGRAWCWGDNNGQQLGSEQDGCTGGRSCSLAPVALDGALRFTALRAGGGLTCGLAEGGALHCWGYGYAPGALGDRRSHPDAAPNQVLAASDFVDLAVGLVHACAIAADDTLHCWGQNPYGQLGPSIGPCWQIDAPCVQTPRPAVPALRFVAVSAGWYHTCGLTAGGEVYCWGHDRHGQLGGQGAGGGTPVRVAAPPMARLAAGATHTCGLDRAGRAWCWGGNVEGQSGGGPSSRVAVPSEVPGGGRFVEIAAGWGNTCALDPSGAAHCWGTRLKGALGDGLSGTATEPVSTVTTRPVTSVDLGSAGGCARLAEGDALCWGEGSLWGSEARDVLEPLQTLSSLPFHQVSRGADHACAVTANSRLVCWGRNDQGQLGDGTTTFRSAPTLVAAPGEFLQVSAGVGHTCAVARGGTPWCWGENAMGELGDGTFERSSVPRRVVVAPPLASISAGSSMTCGVTAEGDAWCWGANGVGQLGVGRVSRADAGPVSGGITFRTLDAAAPRAMENGAACGVDVEGVVSCWGRNASGKMGRDFSHVVVPAPAALDTPLRFRDVAIGDHHACGITDEGALACWGRDIAGDVSGAVPSFTLAPRIIPGGRIYVGLSVGRDFACAVALGATLHCWGERAVGKLGDGVLPWAAAPVPVLEGPVFTLSGSD